MNPRKKQISPSLSIILPCLNEEKGLRYSLPKIQEILSKMNISSEIVVVDNGSSDQSVDIANKYGAIIVNESVQGYGAACMKGLDEASGKYCLIADADGTYDFEAIPKFVNALVGGSEFVIGNRFKGVMEKGAMPWSNRYIGNPILASVLRLFFNTKIHDTHCGIRAITKDAYHRLSLITTGMEFASEMIVAALKHNLRITEIKVNYYKRHGTSKLNKFSDAWRHLRFMLLYKPFFLFFVPGVTLFSFGVLSMSLLYFDAIQFLGVRLYHHPMFLSSLIIITGFQLMLFSLFAKTYAVTHLGEKSNIDLLYRYMSIDRACIIGSVIVILGGVIYIVIFIKWVNSQMGALNEIKNLVIALTLIILGIQTIFSAFMLSILGIKRKEKISS